MKQTANYLYGNEWGGICKPFPNMRAWGNDGKLEIVI